MGEAGGFRTLKGSSEYSVVRLTALVELEYQELSVVEFVVLACLVLILLLNGASSGLFQIGGSTKLGCRPGVGNGVFKASSVQS